MICFYGKKKENKIENSTDHFEDLFAAVSFQCVHQSWISSVVDLVSFCFQVIFLLRNYGHMSKIEVLIQRKMSSTSKKFVLLICFYFRVNMI